MIDTFFLSVDADGHRKFQSWRKRDPDGFFINRKAQTAGLAHRDCVHSGNTEWRATDSGHDLMRQEKICSANLQELTIWASQNQFDLRICHDWRPEEAVAPNPMAVRYWTYDPQIRFWRNDVNAENEPLSSAYSSQFSHTPSPEVTE